MKIFKEYVGEILLGLVVWVGFVLGIVMTVLVYILEIIIMLPDMIISVFRCKSTVLMGRPIKWWKTTMLGSFVLEIDQLETEIER